MVHGLNHQYIKTMAPFTSSTRESLNWTKASFSPSPLTYKQMILMKYFFSIQIKNPISSIDFIFPPRKLSSVPRFPPHTASQQFHYKSNRALLLKHPLVLCSSAFLELKFWLHLNNFLSFNLFYLRMWVEWRPWLERICKRCCCPVKTAF